MRFKYLFSNFVALTETTKSILLDLVTISIMDPPIILIYIFSTISYNPYYYRLLYGEHTVRNQHQFRYTIVVVHLPYLVSIRAKSIFVHFALLPKSVVVIPVCCYSSYWLLPFSNFLDAYINIMRPQQNYYNSQKKTFQKVYFQLWKMFFRSFKVLLTITTKSHGDEISVLKRARVQRMQDYSHTAI